MQRQRQYLETAYRFSSETFPSTPDTPFDKILVLKYDPNLQEEDPSRWIRIPSSASFEHIDVNIDPVPKSPWLHIDLVLVASHAAEGTPCTRLCTLLPSTSAMQLSPDVPVHSVLSAPQPPLRPNRFAHLRHVIPDYWRKTRPLATPSTTTYHLALHVYGKTPAEEELPQQEVKDDLLSEEEIALLNEVHEADMFPFSLHLALHWYHWLE